VRLTGAIANYQLGRVMSALGRGRPNEFRRHQLPVDDVRQRTRVVARQGVGEGVKDLRRSEAPHSHLCRLRGRDEDAAAR
jgi:hypothetical protein